ncbi:Enolase-phosphatase E1 [Strongyloides ratti]|uniref:Enolase-phosphatase E1 n=1 Tax=Strongyloides ratti TaxID=34506 RepID=A0A090KUB4_STRRB|nr:Enolase-phosphatase E1 [Strongyloides ratti]CEF61095.1 Enolase-phosphatase E1 [Strongyloides ratti]
MFKAIVTDIEGTTTSISFVKDVLFPYASNNVNNFLQRFCNDEGEIDSEIIKNVKNVDDLCKNIKRWIHLDKKLTPLKELQGLMWEEAYKNGSIKGHIYDDVLPVLEKLKKKGIKLYVYSSGSIKAQKLIYGYSEKGDLTKLFDNYFDTNIGHKIDSLSYKKIAEIISLHPSDILFLTDVDKEAFAASDAGFQVKILQRPGNASLSQEAIDKFEIINSFDKINF